MVQQLSVLLALSDDLDSVPSIDVGWLATARTSSALLVCLWVLHELGTHACMKACAPMHTNKIYMS